MLATGVAYHRSPPGIVRLDKRAVWRPIDVKREHDPAVLGVVCDHLANVPVHEMISAFVFDGALGTPPTRHTQ